MVHTLKDVRQQLARIRAQVTAAETVLARIRAHGDPKFAEKEASTRQLIEALSAQAEALALRLGGDPPRVLH
ncbi:hypothetical protein [Pseudomonas sp. GM67]|uniref:hypothetical protein n=1 Tax=Pseudomonas sp. GM67 TaxID=1144335 RepID=UPI000270D2BB|nr:hypothetical protein [Pseudomonas sp. GM67]EJM94756.1 hypothetical protein PMI33_00177 [Pseudomonas sp. GM67]